MRPAQGRRHLDLGLLKVFVPGALRRQVLDLDRIVIEARHGGQADGGQLQGHLAADGADAAKMAGAPLSVWMRERLRIAAARELGEAGREVPFLR